MPATYEFINPKIVDYFLARLWLQDLLGYRSPKEVGELSISRALITKDDEPALQLLSDHILRQKQEAI